MTMAPTGKSSADRSLWIINAVALSFFAIATSVSYVRWANFQYRTFDLAYYVQALWQLIHGRFQVSVEDVPLLGNHVEPIVFLFVPLFVIFQHPMLLVVIQNAALATMGPVAYDIGKRLGFSKLQALLLAAALLVTPATGFVALHEFHPEALTAPFLLLMIHARLSGSHLRHWLWFIAVLACKENMALLLTAYCAVHAIAERKRAFADLRGWYLWPMALAIAWFVLCTQVITPALNSGNIDYASLYNRLGNSPRDILFNAVTQPHRLGNALGTSLIRGNLVWGLLLPFLCLPLLKVRWLIIAAPILLQHLLSWRSSEWTIYFHYAAPLLPLFWIATAEGIVRFAAWNKTPALQRGIPIAILIASLVAQLPWGPSYIVDWSSSAADRARKNTLVAKIPQAASVLAPLPYLSHLAMREKLYSLHYVLKGLKTLSQSTYEPPPPTDFVLIDYQDSATFDASAGYYHPAMKTVDGRVIPSSDQLLHNFLKRSSWIAECKDELTLLRRGEEPASTAATNSAAIAQLGAHTSLLSITKSSGTLSDGNPIEIKTEWNFDGARDVFPWLELVATPSDGDGRLILTRGLCAPQAGRGSYAETWIVTLPDAMLPGDYLLEALFFDNTKRAWANASGHNQDPSTLLGPPLALGHVRIVSRARKLAP